MISSLLLRSKRKNYKMVKFSGKDIEKTEPMEISACEPPTKIVIAAKSEDQTMVQPSG